MNITTYSIHIFGADSEWITARIGGFAAYGEMLYAPVAEELKRKFEKTDSKAHQMMTLLWTLQTKKSYHIKTYAIDADDHMSIYSTLFEMDGALKVAEHAFDDLDANIITLTADVEGKYKVDLISAGVPLGTVYISQNNHIDIKFQLQAELNAVSSEKIEALASAISKAIEDVDLLRSYGNNKALRYLQRNAEIIEDVL